MSGDGEEDIGNGSGNGSADWKILELENRVTSHEKETNILKELMVSLGTQMERVSGLLQNNIDRGEVSLGSHAQGQTSDSALYRSHSRGQDNENAHSSGDVPRHLDYSEGNAHTRGDAEHLGSHTRGQERTEHDRFAVGQGQQTSEQSNSPYFTQSQAQRQDSRSHRDHGAAYYQFQDVYRDGYYPNYNENGQYGSDNYQRDNIYPRQHDSREEAGMNGIRVKPYIPKESDWFSYRVYYEHIAKLAGWSDRVKCIKLLGALQGNLSAISLGMEGDNISFDNLLRRLDEVHGASSDRLDASRKLSGCRQKDGETTALYAERIRQLVFRAFPSTNKVDQEELSLRAFLQGLTTKHNLRFEMNKQMFTSLRLAVEFGTNMEMCIRDETLNAIGGKQPFSTRAVSDENRYTEERMAERVCEMVCRSLNKSGPQDAKGEFQNSSQQNNYQRTERRTIQNSPCVLCRQYGHWKNECPDRHGNQDIQSQDYRRQNSGNASTKVNPQSNALNSQQAPLRG